MKFYPHSPTFIEHQDREPPFDFSSPEGWKASPAASRFRTNPQFYRWHGPDADGWVFAELTSGSKWVVGRVDATTTRDQPL